MKNRSISIFEKWSIALNLSLVLICSSCSPLVQGTYCSENTYKLPQIGGSCFSFDLDSSEYCYKLKSETENIQVCGIFHTQGNRVIIENKFNPMLLPIFVSKHKGLQSPNTPTLFFELVDDDIDSRGFVFKLEIDGVIYTGLINSSHQEILIPAAFHEFRILIEDTSAISKYYHRNLLFSTEYWKTQNDTGASYDVSLNMPKGIQNSQAFSLDTLDILSRKALYSPRLNVYFRKK